MLELKVTIAAAADLMFVLNSIAAALNAKDLKPVAKAGAPATPASVVPPMAPTAPVNPTPAQAIQPTAAPAIMPLTAEQVAPPIVPMVPVATPAPAVTPAANAVPAPTVPTSAPQYTLDMIATAGAALVDTGKLDQLTQLLDKFGVASITELAPESYGAVANGLRALGAAI